MDGASGVEKATARAGAGARARRSGRKAKAKVAGAGAGAKPRKAQDSGAGAKVGAVEWGQGRSRGEVGLVVRMVPKSKPGHKLGLGPRSGGVAKAKARAGAWADDRPGPGPIAKGDLHTDVACPMCSGRASHACVYSDR